MTGFNSLAQKMDRAVNRGEKPHSKSVGMFQYQVKFRDFGCIWCIWAKATGTFNETGIHRRNRSRCLHSQEYEEEKTTNSGFSLWYIDQPSTVHDSPIVEAHRIVGKFTSRHRRTNRPTLTSIQTRDGASCDHTGGQEGNRCRDYR